MKPHRISPAILWLLLTGLLLPACSDDSPTKPDTDDQVPDFAIVDVNPTSASVDQAVSPRDYLQKVSAWYFGHST